MKNKFIILGLLTLLMTSISGCSDQLEDKYLNPEQSTDASIPGFFTSMLNNDRVRPSYWNVRTFLLPHPAVYTQTAFFMNSNSVYQQNDDYSDQYWRDFYVSGANGGGVLSTYAAMQVNYEGLTDQEKEDNEIFMHAAKVILIDEASKMVDLWGDIPFSETASLIKTGTIENGKFDDQEELYYSFINDLKEAADYFASASTTGNFSRYDILLSGDTDKWTRYVNSLRLRLLMRISYVDEATAQTEIMNMLNNSGNYPLIDGGNAGDYDPAASDVLLQPVTTYQDDLTSALTELPSHYAPDYMLNTVMLPAEDPRIPIMFDKYGRTEDDEFIPNEEYKAMPITFTATQQEQQNRNYSILDSITFIQNPDLPGIVITAPEVNFLKAEAYEKWGGGDPQAAYETAVKQSVSFYYYLNGANQKNKSAEEKPESSVIEEFITNENIAYTGSREEKLAKIWTQKWLHYGFLQSTQAWAEYRRTGYPELTFPEATLSGYRTPPSRLVYPSTEKNYNSQNYQAVQGQDVRDGKIFWDVD
ncbi:SusD/RagB family nutrient-binding outer membrane lipoprotein [Sinomicrobium pectinilyticum]|uniref:SusD/RagB family nutrient-binding outer membrane lipoprotein n=1 Tax=Sinomicrobium pectinilyticum TaxID=1084421 RepID=A0A3N0E485_SINP1|nr:SusD/RagB family nutrient-binding outer membrane lipoprotein [Sinomicrobium pectinilyticum]RNL82589.1 SusD/RagB family nutrient-binding outer membrane lipoprotein [Sinomicrobium pectinilyticum]